MGHLCFDKTQSKASFYTTLMVFNNCFHNSLRWKKYFLYLRLKLPQRFPFEADEIQ